MSALIAAPLQAVLDLKPQIYALLILGAYCCALKIDNNFIELIPLMIMAISERLEAKALSNSAEGLLNYDVNPY
jgi:hypothetical protein